MHQSHNAKFELESDSLLAVTAITGEREYILEVGDVIEDCKQKLSCLPQVKISFFRKNAKKVAHELTKIPCLVHFPIDFTSPPTCLLEALSFDCLN